MKVWKCGSVEMWKYGNVEVWKWRRIRATVIDERYTARYGI
ncbi:MAG TPA: hypothetical protein VGI38_07580 [Puia sp.]